MANEHKRTRGDASESGSRLKKRHKSIAPHANAPKISKCAFVELPGELRNKIYGFVLTEPHGALHVSKVKGKPRLCISIARKNGTTKKVEANQLQYVNKQIRAETKGYSLQLNVLQFATTQTDEPSILRSCLNFMQTVKPYWLEKMAHIRIFRQEVTFKTRADEDEDLYYDFKAQEGLFEICRQNPHLEVRWECPSWKMGQSLCPFLDLSASIIHAYRGIDVLARFEAPGQHLNSWRTWDEHEALLRKAPLNFKVHPKGLRAGREKLEALLDSAFEYCNDHHPAMAFEVELEKMILSWFDDGI